MGGKRGIAALTKAGRCPECLDHKSSHGADGCLLCRCERTPDTVRESMKHARRCFNCDHLRRLQSGEHRAVFVDRMGTREIATVPSDTPVVYCEFGYWGGLSTIKEVQPTGRLGDNVFYRHGGECQDYEDVRLVDGVMKCHFCGENATKSVFDMPLCSPCRREWNEEVIAERQLSRIERRRAKHQRMREKAAKRMERRKARESRYNSVIGNMLN